MSKRKFRSEWPTMVEELSVEEYDKPALYECDICDENRADRKIYLHLYELPRKANRNDETPWMFDVVETCPDHEAEGKECLIDSPSFSDVTGAQLILYHSWFERTLSQSKEIGMVGQDRWKRQKQNVFNEMFWRLERIDLEDQRIRPSAAYGRSVFEKWQA